MVLEVESGDWARPVWWERCWAWRPERGWASFLWRTIGVVYGVGGGVGGAVLEGI